MTTPEEQATIDQFMRDIAGIGAAAVEEGKSAIQGIVAHFQAPLGDQSGGIISDVAGDLLKGGASINDAELFGWGSELDQGMRGPIDPSTGLPTDKLFARSEFTDPEIPAGGLPPPPPAGVPPPPPAPPAGTWPGFGDEAEPVGTDTLPTLTARELQDAEDIITAELRLAGFNTSAIESMVNNWIIPRLTGQFIDTVTGKKMPSPTDPKNLLPELFERPEFKERFPGYHPRLEAGYNAIDIQDYLAYESTFKELMYTHGLDQYINTSTNTKVMDTYIGDLITGNISIEQVQQRINQGVSAVMSAPVQVQETFKSWYGDQTGENALLATFLDPNEDLFDLKNMAQASIAGGLAIDILGEEGRITQSMAEEIADLDYSNQQLQQAYTQLSQQTMLFAEKTGEQEDMTLAREGVKSALNLDQDVQERIARRKRQRMGDFSGGGGAMVSGTTTGFGSANA